MALMLLLPVLLLLPSNASAQGMGVAPAKFTINNALRGAEYERPMIVYNIFSEARDFALSSGDEMSGWISFYKLDDLNTPISNITIPGEESANILVKFNIPQDAANGVHTSKIWVETTPAQEGEGGMVVPIKISSEVEIEVTGTQILTGEVKSITIRDTEIDHLLRIKVEFQNTGNVMAKPQIDVNITKDSAPIDSFSYSETEVMVEAREVIPVEWDTTGRETGEYVADVSVSLGGNVLTAQSLPFKILPTGTLTRWGELTELSYEGRLAIETVVKITATFQNTGEIDTIAKLVCEVYKDDVLIDTINSEQMLIPVKEEGLLKAYLKLHENGHYNIKGYAVYDGKTTETKEVSFDVGEVSPGFTGLLLIGVAAGIGVMVVGGIIAYRIRNRKNRSRESK
jgi:hypothetical protein